MSSQLYYYGESTCKGIKRDGSVCVNKAYYVGELCGVHSKDKIALPKNPDAGKLAEQKLHDDKVAIEQAMQLNKAQGKRGQLILTKLAMMKSPPDVKGFLKVFPNYKHGNRRDGWDLPALSPKSIGPVHHGQPGLPPSENLENLHQGNKLFHGESMDEFVAHRFEMYTDKIPHRHKSDKYPQLKHISNKNIPIKSIWINKSGIPIDTTYFESRQVYCNIYYKMIVNHLQYLKLAESLNDGYNLQICGYDAYPITHTIEYHYLDTSKPFGHELVLYAMLMNDLIWEKYTFLDNLFIGK